jgi:hypothetical protein
MEMCRFGKECWAGLCAGNQGQAGHTQGPGGKGFHGGCLLENSLVHECCLVVCTLEKHCMCGNRRGAVHYDQRRYGVVRGACKGMWLNPTPNSWWLPWLDWCFTSAVQAREEPLLQCGGTSQGHKYAAAAYYDVHSFLCSAATAPAAAAAGIRCLSLQVCR